MSVRIKVTGIKETFQDLENAVAKEMKSTAIQDIMANESEPLLKTVKSLTPRADKVVHRYSVKGDRTRANSRILDTYEIGNLANSMEIFKGSRLSVPSIHIGANAGSGKGRIVKDDGWYAFMVIHGTKYQAPNDFMKRAEQAGGSDTEQRIETKLKTYLEEQLNESINN